ncbi:GntR family transcriptional regulator [Sporolactobacillus shoreae]|nr:GntR family transcriptional regulator [Sporolactobacillus shoreae]
MNSADQPIYQQIRNQIAEQILNGGIEEGGQLPSIRALAKELGISVITTKRAYEDLENDGLIDSVPGKGFFVSLHDKNALRKKQLAELQTQLKQLIGESKKYGMTLNQMVLLIKKWYMED